MDSRPKGWIRVTIGRWSEINDANAEALFQPLLDVKRYASSRIVQYWSLISVRSSLARRRFVLCITCR